MTSPVEMNSRGMLDNQGRLNERLGEWTMSFLYRTPEIGPTGNFENNVKVIDRPEITVISVALSAQYTFDEYNAAI